MASMRIVTAVLFAAALAIPTSSAAARSVPTSHQATKLGVVSRAKAPTPIVAAVAVSSRYWGAVACNGAVKIRAQRAVPAGLASATDAWVTFDSSLGANNLAAPASSYRNCTINFARWRWARSASMREDWDMFCTTMVHEVGHLLGHIHDVTPGSVMAPVFTDHSSVPSICRATRPNR